MWQKLVEILRVRRLHMEQYQKNSSSTGVRLHRSAADMNSSKKRRKQCHSRDLSANCLQWRASCVRTARFVVCPVPNSAPYESFITHCRRGGGCDDLPIWKSKQVSHIPSVEANRALTRAKECRANEEFTSEPFPRLCLLSHSEKELFLVIFSRAKNLFINTYLPYATVLWHIR